MRTLSIALTILLPSLAAAGPVQFTQQGRLLDELGTPYQGAHTLDVHLYDTASGGTPVWDKDFGSIDFNGGFFAVTLSGTGDNGASLDTVMGSGDALWLGLSVDSAVEMSPRQPMAHVPQAAWAERAGGASLIDIGSDGTGCTVIGGLGYDAASQSLYLCNGTSWIPAAVANTGIASDGTSRQWADGDTAASCNDYRFPSDGHTYSGADATTGIYTLNSGSGDYLAYCDMDTDGGGWTLVLRASNNDSGINLGPTGTGWSSTGYRDVTDLSLTDISSAIDHVSPAYAQVGGDNVLVRERLGADLLHAVYTDDDALAGADLRSITSQTAIDSGRVCFQSLVYPDPSTSNTANYDALVLSGDEVGDTEPARIALRSACGGDSQLIQMGYTRSGHGSWEVWSQDNNAVTWPGFRSAFVFVR